MILFSIENVLIRHLGGEIPVPQMVFLRNIISLCLFVPIMLHHGIGQLKTQRFGRHALRAFIGLLAMESWFYSLSYLPVNVATAISFTAPLFGTIFAVIFLKEVIGVPRIIALIVGFGGILFITNPFNDATWNPVMLAALFSAAMIAGVGVIVKTLTTTEPGWRIVCYMAILMSIMSFPFAIPVWGEVSLHGVHIMFWVAALSTLAQFCLVWGFRRASVVTLMPFDFTRLVFTALLAWIFLKEGLNFSTILGSSVIISSTIYIAWRDQKRQGGTAPEAQLS